MRLICLVIGSALLAGCFAEPNPPEPRKICTNYEEVRHIRGGIGHQCIEWEIGCIKPLRLAQEESGRLICRLPRE